MAASRIQLFILTFVCYVSIHALRTTYSFSKHFLDQALEVDKSAIGFVDSMLLLSLGIGHLSHVKYPLKHPVKSLWIATLLCALNYMLIPLLIETWHIKSFALLFVLMAINGYLQSFTWPALLMIVHKNFNPKENSTLLGFWSCNTNIGNITGYFICYQLILAHNFHWEVGMYMTGLFVAVCAFFIWLRVQQMLAPEQQQPTAQQMIALRKGRQELQQHMKLRTIFSQSRVVFTTLAFSFIKSVIYGIMLWLPIYFHDIGLVQYETWIPMTYDVASIAGSLALGYAFKRIKSEGAVLGFLMFVLVILFLLLKYMELVVVGYFVLIAGVGACLGGSFNIMSGLVTMELTKVVSEQYRNQSLGFFSALTMSVANFTTALTQILIGYVAQKDQHMIFLIFLVYSFLALLCFMMVMKAQILESSDPKTSFDSQRTKGSLIRLNWFQPQTVEQMVKKMEKCIQKTGSQNAKQKIK